MTSAPLAPHLQNTTKRGELAPFYRGQIIGRRAAGQSYKEISTDTGIPRSTARDAIEKEDPELVGENLRLYKRGQIVGRKAAGQSYADISRETGIPRSTVYEAINPKKRVNIKPRRKRAKRDGQLAATPSFKSEDEKDIKSPIAGDPDQGGGRATSTESYSSGCDPEPISLNKVAGQLSAMIENIRQPGHQSYDVEQVTGIVHQALQKIQEISQGAGLKSEPRCDNANVKLEKPDNGLSE